MEAQFVFVKIDLNKLESYDEIWYNTICPGGFYGKLINQCWDTFYFSLEDGTLIAIPIKWVRWMAPLHIEEKEQVEVEPEEIKEVMENDNGE